MNIYFLNDILNSYENYICFFIIVIICFKKCNFLINDLYNYGNFLEKIYLMIGSKRDIFYFCLGFGYKVNFSIDCLLWNVSKLYI